MTQTDFYALAKYFRALSDRLRLRMLHALSAGGEMNVSDLAERLEVSQPLVSWHLRPLVRAGLVRVRRAGRASYCSLSPNAFRLHEDAVAGLLAQRDGSGEHGTGAG